MGMSRRKLWQNQLIQMSDKCHNSLQYFRFPFPYIQDLFYKAQLAGMQDNYTDLMCMGDYHSVFVSSSCSMFEMNTQICTFDNV